MDLIGEGITLIFGFLLKVAILAVPIHFAIYFYKNVGSWIRQKTYQEGSGKPLVTYHYSFWFIFLPLVVPVVFYLGALLIGFVIIGAVMVGATLYALIQAIFTYF